jgi:antitoxin HigA-1
MKAIALIEGFPINGLSAIHPGEFLREVIDDLMLTQAAIGQAIGVSPMRVSLLLKGQRPITA